MAKTVNCEVCGATMFTKKEWERRIRHWRGPLPRLICKDCLLGEAQACGLFSYEL